jgi:hypothetical protein
MRKYEADWSITIDKHCKFSDIVFDDKVQDMCTLEPSGQLPGAPPFTVDMPCSSEFDDYVIDMMHRLTFSEMVETLYGTG